MASSRKLKLRRADFCVECDTALGKGSEAWWDATARSVTCLSCRSVASGVPAGVEAVESRQARASGTASEGGGGTAVPLGRAGAGALREYERRRSRRVEKTRADHPLVGEVLLALRKAPQHEVAFKRGAQGEAIMARSLEQRLAGTSVVFLHDRGMPRGYGNIDHLAVAPSGVFVIDAKNLSGKVRVAAPLVGKPKLMVKGRDRTKLIDGLDRQVAAVGQALAGDEEEIPVSGVLCFLKDADLPLVGRQRMRGHELLYRKALVKRLKAPGPLGDPEIQSLATRLAAAFPAA